MNITNNKVVQFNYKVFEGETELESTHSGEPVLYLHGHNNMLEALEKELEGKATGDNFKVTLDPKDAYGEITETEPRRVPRKHIITKGKLTPGMIIDVNTTDGPVAARVVKVGLKNVDLDTNHPYAGKTLTFEVDVVDVRDATEDEISHGHAHGVGGHHHH